MNTPVLGPSLIEVGQESVEVRFVHAHTQAQGIIVLAQPADNRHLASSRSWAPARGAQARAGSPAAAGSRTRSRTVDLRHPPRVAPAPPGPGPLRVRPGSGTSPVPPVVSCRICWRPVGVGTGTRQRPAPPARRPGQRDPQSLRSPGQLRHLAAKGPLSARTTAKSPPPASRCPTSPASASLTRGRRAATFRADEFTVASWYPPTDNFSAPRFGRRAMTPL